MAEKYCGIGQFHGENYAGATLLPRVISGNEAMALHRFEEDAAKKALLHMMGFRSQDQIDASGAEKLLAFSHLIYHSFKFASKAGFPPTSIGHVVILTYELLVETTGASISNAVSKLPKLLIRYRKYFTAQQVKLLTDWFRVSYLQHYMLYQHVLVETCSVWELRDTIYIDIPFEVSALKYGMEEELYQWLQKLKVLQEREMELKSRHAQYRAHLGQQETNLYEDPFLGAPPTRTVREEELKAIVEDTTAAHISLVNQALVDRMQEYMETINIKCDYAKLYRIKPRCLSFLDGCEVATDQKETSMSANA